MNIYLTLLWHNQLLSFIHYSIINTYLRSLLASSTWKTLLSRWARGSGVASLTNRTSLSGWPLAYHHINVHYLLLIMIIIQIQLLKKIVIQLLKTGSLILFFNTSGTKSHYETSIHINGLLQNENRSTWI